MIPNFDTAVTYPRPLLFQCFHWHCAFLHHTFGILFPVDVYWLLLCVLSVLFYFVPFLLYFNYIHSQCSYIVFMVPPCLAVVAGVCLCCFLPPLQSVLICFVHTLFVGTAPLLCTVDAVRYRFWRMVFPLFWFSVPFRDQENCPHTCYYGTLYELLLLLVLFFPYVDWLFNLLLFFVCLRYDSINPHLIMMPYSHSLLLILLLQAVSSLRAATIPSRWCFLPLRYYRTATFCPHPCFYAWLLDNLQIAVVRWLPLFPSAIVALLPHTHIPYWYSPIWHIIIIDLIPVDVFWWLGLVMLLCCILHVVVVIVDTCSWCNSIIIFWWWWYFVPYLITYFLMIIVNWLLFGFLSQWYCYCYCWWPDCCLLLFHCYCYCYSKWRPTPDQVYINCYPHCALLPHPSPIVFQWCPMTCWWWPFLLYPMENRHLLVVFGPGRIIQHWPPYYYHNSINDK